MSERLVSIHRAKPMSNLAAQSDRFKPKIVPTPQTPLVTSVSELRDFMDCRVKWSLRHQSRLEPKSGSVALGMGSLTHLILETWYKVPHAKRTVKRMEKIARQLCNVTQRKELSLEDKELIEAMTVGYASWTLSPENEHSDVQLGYEEGFPEEWFRIPLDDDGSVLLNGKLDNRFIPKKLKKTLALFEFKTASQIRMSRYELSIQVAGYAAAMRSLYGEQFKRFIVYPTVLRKQLPGPRVKAALFAREPVELTEDEVRIAIADLRRAALDMADASVYANPGERCEWMCDFRIPCQLRGAPSDMKHVLKTEYQPKEYRA